jgi:hypothetical protein
VGRVDLLVGGLLNSIVSRNIAKFLIEEPSDVTVGTSFLGLKDFHSRSSLSMFLWLGTERMILISNC